MTKQRRTRLSILGLISLTLIIAAASYGFAEAGAIPSAGILGVEYGVVSDLQVSKVSYTLDVDEPSTFTAVVFEVDRSGGSISAGVSVDKEGSIVWADQCDRAGSRWTCTFEESIDVLAADWLHVAGQ